MRDEHVGEREGRLEAPEELQHARLDGDVEPGGRLVQDHHARAQRQDAGEPDPALLAAAQLVRIEVEVRVGQPDRREDRPHLALALGPRERRVDLQRLVERVDDLPARVERRPRVLVDVLEILGDRRRSRRGRRPDLPAANRMSPAVGVWMPMTVLPSVDFPQPLSPTRPSVSPGRTESDTPSTARSQPTRRPKALRSGK